MGDLDGDGLEDIYAAQPGGVANRLFIHRADGRTYERALEAGVGFLENTRGVLILDLDSDGNQDLVLAMGPNLVLAFNRGGASFKDFRVLQGFGTSHVHSIAAADVDGDGDLDLYACRYNRAGGEGTLTAMPIPYHDARNGGRNLYWRNEGRRVFVDATVESGLDADNTRFSLDALWEDFDNDGDPDLFVANDFGSNSFYRNQGGGRFIEDAEAAGTLGVGASMGVSAADFDHDGDMDLYVSNMFSSAGLRIVGQETRFMEGEHQDLHGRYMRHARGNTLYVNRGDGSFEDLTEESGTAMGRWAWGAHFVDFDNDGWEDIYVPNGFVTGADKDDL